MSEKKFGRKCFCCKKDLVNEINGGLEHEFSDPPNYATVWTSRGNWGSVVLDRSPGEPSVELYICDNCLVERQDLCVEFNEITERKVVDVKQLKLDTDRLWQILRKAEQENKND